MSNTIQLERNIAFCIDELDLDDYSIGEMLRCIEHMGIASVEYFCEEFVFQSDTEEDHDRLHDENYLKLNWRLD